MSNGSVIVAPSNSTFFTNANQYDFLFYTASNSQKLLFGVNSNAPASLTFSSNLCAINGNIAINNTLAVNGLSIAMNNGTMANITTSSVAGFSNTSNGVQISMASNTSNNMIVFKGSNTTLATLTGNANLYMGSNVGVGYSNYPTDPSGDTGNIITSGNISAGNLGMFRNRIINGDMRINQRGAKNVALTNNTTTYTIDRFATWCAGAGSVTSSYVTLISTDAPYQYGCRSSFKNIITTAYANTNATQVQQYQSIEGNNIQDFNWGLSYGSSVTASFWVRTVGITSLAVSIQSSGGAWCYNSNISIMSSATWQYVSVVIPPPPVLSAGVWGTGTNVGFPLVIGATMGGTISAASGWVADVPPGTSTGTTVWHTTVGNYVEFTGVQLEKGTIATPFEFRPYTIELLLCQRYYVKSYRPNDSPGTTTAWNNMFSFNITTASTVVGTRATVSLPCTMRLDAPTVTVYNPRLGTMGSIEIFYETGGVLTANYNTTGSGSATSTQATFTYNGALPVAYNLCGARLHYTISAE